MLPVFGQLCLFSLLSNPEKSKREVIRDSSEERAENSPVIYMERKKKILTICQKGFDQTKGKKINPTSSKSTLRHNSTGNQNSQNHLFLIKSFLPVKI